MKMKRTFDFIVSLLLFIIVTPLLAVVALLVLLNLGKPVCFYQKRPGLNGVPFHIVKFRTMNYTTTSDGMLLSDTARLTRFGKFLRSASIDELPELWNVLRGDMSLVGPRPLLLEYLPLYSKLQMRRHEVRPGITGWAQVNGRNALSWDDKFKYDIWYIDNHTFLIDLKILWKTIFSVVLRNGINQEGEIPMIKFKGNHRSHD